MDDLGRILAHHARTEHRLHRYARSPGALDWSNQPDPFRTFEGAEILDLPLHADDLRATYADVLSPGRLPPRPLDRDGVALLFELGLGLAAWKQFGDARWALRCNPSSGNLHPTEGYALLGRIPGLRTGVAHYDSRSHRLERRCGGDPGPALPDGCLVVGLSTIPWREAWKYGERAFRYCQLDAGHALATIAYAAAALGWSARLVDGLCDADLGTLLGLDRPGSFAAVAPADREHPVLALAVGPPGVGVEARGLAELATWFRASPWAGSANSLSAEHVDWPEVDAAVAATLTPETPAADPEPTPAFPPAPEPPPVPAAALIRRRRSCLGLDGSTGMAAPAFYALLDRLLPRPGVPPFDALPWRARVHLGLFVHRVEGLPPGLYLLARDPGAHGRLREAMHPDFAWARPPGCPDHLPLDLLRAADLRAAARTASCHQEIASDGAFAAAMLAEFEPTMVERGAWWYRRLHWEAGMLGQALYLEAEAAGLGGTGIGCFFDGVTADQFGLRDGRFRPIYHFTVGRPVDDPRLTTLPAYAHLEAARRG